MRLGDAETGTWATRTNPVYVEEVKILKEGGSQESNKPPRWWATEHVERREGSEGKPG